MICPACLTIGEAKRSPVAATVLGGLAAVVGALASIAVSGLATLVIGLFLWLVAAVFAALSRWSMRRNMSCESCGGRSLPVSTPGGQECWDRLKAKRKTTSRR